MHIYGQQKAALFYEIWWYFLYKNNLSILDITRVSNILLTMNFFKLEERKRGLNLNVSIANILKPF